MKLRKAVKKIVALGTGATMLGATLFGAMAANLADYPSPLFVKDGEFDGIIVVGDAAASADVIGAVDIATNLQFEAKESVPLSVSGTSGTTVVEGDAFKIAKSGDALNLNEQLTDTEIDTVTADDLNSLADGTIRNQKGTFKYNQYIDLPENAMVTYDVDTDQSDDPNAYLMFADGAVVYTYKATFPTALESDVDDDGDLDDLDNKKITLLGKEYTILNTDNKSNGALRLELMGGAVQDTMEEYTTKTYTLNGVDYEVEVIAISGAPEVILKINGEVTDKLSESDTFTLQDGTEVGIKTILENEGTESGGGDIVEFYLGASKVVLEESSWTSPTWSTIEVGEDTMDAEVNFEGSMESSGTLVKISEIQINWTADQDYWVPLGGSLSDQLDDDEKGNLFLENIDFQLASLDRGAVEDISLNPNSDNLQLKLTTKTGGEFTFDAFYEDGSGNAKLGESAAKPLTIDPATALNKNHYFILSEGKFSHVMQVNKFEDGDEQVWFEDVANGNIQKVSVSGGCDGDTDSDMILDGKTYIFRAHCADEWVNFTSFGGDHDVAGWATIYTKNEAKVLLMANTTLTGYVRVMEDERDDASASANYTQGFQVPITQYSNENELAVGTPTAVGASGLDLEDWDSKDNYKDGWTNFGTYISYDSEDNGKIDIEYPSSEMEVAVYVTSGATSTKSVAGSSGGDLTSTTVNAIPVGTAKLASEVSNVASQNMIVVGGPCANSVAATLMGRAQSWPACGEGFEEGKAIIKLYENGNKVAMLVAGATALDTRRASRVLSEFDAYSLSGSEMQVVGTSTTFSDTVVSAVTMQEPVEEEMMDEEVGAE